jgi:hypothetical protein
MVNEKIRKKEEKTLRHHDLNPRLIILEMTNLAPSYLFIADQP